MSDINNPGKFEYAAILQGDAVAQDRLRSVISALIQSVSIIEGSVAPTQQAVQHQWYFDNVTSKYYRNTDGGTTWVALN